MSAQPRTRLNFVLTALLGLVVVVLANYVSSRHYKRWDWTTHGLFTLSERSQQVLRELDADVVANLVVSWTSTWDPNWVKQQVWLSLRAEPARSNTEEGPQFQRRIRQTNCHSW